LWALFTSAFFIYRGVIKEFSEKNKNFSENILRKRKKRKKRNLGLTTHDAKQIKPKLKLNLKNEFRSAVILTSLVNLLLLIINIIDIYWVWFNFELTNDFDLSQFVHEGTYLLILSILLSMGIMLYYFRRNINFYTKKIPLQILSYIWIFQNLILLISVAVRNLHYIEHYDLAYKRIGVFFFLTFVLFGLITLYLKIKNKKTIYYLLKTNALALYAGFILFAIPDWDTIIAKHNLKAQVKENIDIQFLLSLDEKTFPMINEDKEVLKLIETNSNYERYNHKINNFITDYESKSFFSWNYADYKSYKYFNDLGLVKNNSN